MGHFYVRESFDDIFRSYRHSVQLEQLVTPRPKFVAVTKQFENNLGSEHGRKQVRVCVSLGKGSLML